jgi:hypothetical protein
LLTNRLPSCFFSLKCERVEHRAPKSWNLGSHASWCGSALEGHFREEPETKTGSVPRPFGPLPPTCMATIAFPVLDHFISLVLCLLSSANMNLVEMGMLQAPWVEKA